MNEKTAGYIYCIYNESFKSYGENTFKLGRTGNLNNRLANYTTYYITPCKFVFTSLDCERKFKDCIKIKMINYYVFDSSSDFEDFNYSCVDSCRLPQ